MSTASTVRKNKVKAILAGGLVLGVGAMVTLAAWNDSEFAQGDFAAGTFNLQGSVDGEDFADHDNPAEPAILNFIVPADNLAPGDIVTAPFALRLSEETTNDSVVTVSMADFTNNAAGLTYTLVQTTTFGNCSAPDGDVLVSAGTALDTVPGTPTFLLGMEDQVNLCFIVTADEDLTQGQTATAVWEFNAESQTESD